MANADRGTDRSFAYRDAIDLGYLVGSHAEIPRIAIQKAEAAYGEDMAHKVARVLSVLLDMEELGRAAETLGMPARDVAAATRGLRAAALNAWQDLEIPGPAESDDAALS